MLTWQEDLLMVADGGPDPDGGAFFARLSRAAQSLGFDYCAFGARAPLPLTRPRTVLLSNYPTAWQQRYAQAGYLEQDPSVRHCRQTQAPVLWSDALFAGTPQLWEEARAAGLRHGWAQSSFDAHGIGGMLTLAREHDPLGAAELARNEVRMRWMANVAHLSLSRLLLAEDAPGRLTSRETEVLKWTADGKTSSEISSLLAVSENTINFHVKNAIVKLNVANKTAAVVKAAMLGMLA